MAEREVPTRRRGSTLVVSGYLIPTGAFAAYEEALGVPVLHERRFRSLFTADHENSLTLLIVEVRVNVRQKHVTNAVFDQVYEVQSHLVLTWESIRVQSENVAVVCYADKQRPSLGI